MELPCKGLFLQYEKGSVQGWEIMPLQVWFIEEHHLEAC